MKILRPIAIVLIFAVTVILIQRLTGLGTAPVPKVFARGLTLDEAIDLGKSEKRPVLVFATADWCGPCQQMKRSILSEPSVEQQISRDFVPAYVDIDRVAGAAERLKVFSIPATIILWDGRQVARMEGVIPHDSYQKWLEAAHGQALSDTPFVERAGDEFIQKLNAEPQTRESSLPADAPGGADSPARDSMAPPR